MYSEGLLLEMLTAEKKGNYKEKGNINLVYETAMCGDCRNISI